jgi:zinc protease
VTTCVFERPAGLSRDARRGLGLTVAALVGVCSLLSGAPAIAAKVTPPNHPWPQTVSDLTADPAVRFGTLPNGMRYAILRNTTPSAEVSIRFRIDAGSLNERDDQRGLAHFLEHMSFRGSTHVPEAEEWKGLQRLGMAAGADVSAFTTETQTFYQFDLPNADDKSVDAGLMRMRETASELLLRQDGMDAERGPILGEERVRDTPDFRAIQIQRGFFYKGQLVPNRAPIGTVDIIQHAPVSLVRQFYHAYYRPERATLIVVGDIDPDAVEAKIKAHFADWTPVGPPGPEAQPGVPLKRGEEVKLVIDPNISRGILVGWMAPYDTTPDTQARARHYLIQNIGLTILNRRYQIAANSADRPFLEASIISRSLLHSARMTMLGVNNDPQHWRSALITAETMRRQILQFGVQQVEVDREVEQLLTYYKTYAAGEATRQTPSLAAEMLSSVDQDDVIRSPTQELALISGIIKGLTADQVNTAMRGAFAGSGPLVFIAAPTPIAGGEDTVAAAFAAAEAAPITAPAAEAKLVWPYTSFGPIGKVVERHHVDDLDVTTVRFANNVRLTIKPTTFTKDQVLVSVKIGGGLLELPRDRTTARWAGDAGALVQGGLKAMPIDDIQRVLASKIYGLGFSARDDGFVFSSGTRPEDLDTQLQVFAAYVTAPGWRPQAFDRIKSDLSPVLNDLAASPNGVVQRDLSYLLHSEDPRWANPTHLDIAAEHLEDLRAVLDKPLADGAIEVTIIGDVTPARAIDLVAATFGALPTRQAVYTPPPEAIVAHFPAPNAMPLIRYHKGRVDQGMALIAWPGIDIYANMQTPRDLRIAEQIMQTRLFDQLRIADGATYQAQTNLETSEVFPGYGYVYALAEVPPAKVQLFFDTVTKIAADMRAKDVTPDELERARQPRVELFTKGQQTNSYWLNALIGVQTDPRKLEVIRSTIPDLKHVTIADVRRAAQTFLTDDKAWRMVVLPQPAPPAADAPKPVMQVGVVVMNCVASPENRLSDCHVLKETPAGRGLGSEAILLSPNVRMDPKTLPAPVNGRSQITIRLPLPPPGA